MNAPLKVKLSGYIYVLVYQKKKQNDIQKNIKKSPPFNGGFSLNS